MTCEWCGKEIPPGTRTWITPQQLATSPTIGSIDTKHFRFCTRVCAQAEMDFYREEEYFKLLEDAREAEAADRAADYESEDDDE